MRPTPSSRRTVLCAAAALFAIGAALLLVRLLSPVATLPVDKSLIRPWQGQAYAFDCSPMLPPRAMRFLLDIASDTNESPAASPLVLLEDGKPLPTPHALHADIAAKGGGRYSHWQDDVIFAASDGSAPATNGRSYAVSIPLVPAAWLPTVLIVLGLAGVAVGARERIRAAVDRNVRTELLRRIGTGGSLAAFALGVAATVLHCISPTIERRLDPGSIRQREGNSYTVWISEYLPHGLPAMVLGLDPDANDSPSASRLGVRENGIKMGPPHSMHADVALNGGGRFSHWGPELIFSSSDNTNPATNGRVYSAAIPLAPVWWLPLVLIAAGIAGMRRYAETRAIAGWLFAKRAVFFWAGGIALNAYFNVVFDSLLVAPVPSPDSQGYLQWSLFRTPGYPLFLAASRALVGSWQYLPFVQLNLLAGSVLLFAYAIARATNSYLAGWIVIALTVASGDMIATAGEILTEPAFTAFLMAHIALFLVFLEKRWMALGLLAGACLGAAILIKSVAVVMLGPVLVFIAFLAGRRRAIAALVLLPAAVAWLAPSAYNYVTRGFFESSIAGGYALVGHVAWAIHPVPGAPLEKEARAIEQRLRPVLAKRPAHFGSLDQYVDYTSNEYNTLLWGNIVPEMSTLFTNRCSPAVCAWGGCPPDACSLLMNRAFLQLSKQAISRHPAEYAYHVYAHDVALWRDAFAWRPGFVYGVLNRANWLPQAYDPKVNIYLQLLGPLPPFKPPHEVYEIARTIEDSALSHLLDLVLARDFVQKTVLFLPYKMPRVMMAISLVGCLLAFRLRKAGPLLRAYSYVALCLNAYFVGTALAQPSLVRYAAAMQGLLAALLVLSAAFALWHARRAWRSRRRAAADPIPEPSL